MARISLVSYDQADDTVKQVMDGHEAKGYRITNMKRTLLHSVTAFQSLEDGVYNLQEKLEEFLDQRTVVFFGYAVSTEDECIVCSTYFAKILESWGIDFSTFAFTETEELLIALARQIVNNKGKVSGEILDQLQAKFNEKEIVEIVAFAVMIVANNLFNNILDVESELL